MMLDITGADYIQVEVSHDGKVIWVNTPEECILRICKISCLEIEDNRGDEAEEIV